MTKIFKFEKVGELGSSRGVDGGIKFIGSEEMFAFLLESQYIFVKMKDGNPVPYLIENADFKGNYILYLEDIQTPEQAKDLTGCSVLLESSEVLKDLLGKAGESNLHFAFLKNFLILDKTSGFQSTIMEVESYPQQEMAILDSGHLVPLHDDFIIDIEREKQRIVMELPEGLFDE